MATWNPNGTFGMLPFAEGLLPLWEDEHGELAHWKSLVSAP